MGKGARLRGHSGARHGRHPDTLPEFINWIYDRVIFRTLSRERHANYRHAAGRGKESVGGQEDEDRY